tara:strand:- start:371 stop:682 length:312 start_codon:yes stop_codon:yes gene_type:complete
MSKNYKLIVFREPNCSPCELLGTLPSGSAASNGYEYEEVELTRRTPEQGGWSNAPFSDFYGTPWFVLQDRDVSTSLITSETDSSIVDSFYGGNEARFNILINK